MDKRGGRRYKRRLQLRFWDIEDEVQKAGFTQNVSLEGMFICTGSPAKPGTRIVIEVHEKEKTYTLHGVVRHSARVDPVLQKVRPSGMGVRLIKTEELMAALLKINGVSKNVEDQEPPEVEGLEEVEETADEARVVAMTFGTPQEFLNCFERDLKFGGIFVPVDDLPEQDEFVTIEFQFKWDRELKVGVAAQVVKIFEAAEGTAMGETVTGVGVAFTDPADAIRHLEEVVGFLET